MDFAKIANLSIGLAAFLGGLWLVLQIIKTLRHGMGEKAQPTNHSGERSVDFWKTEIRAAVKDTLIETAPLRHEQLEGLFEKVIEREFGKRDKVLREIIRDELERR